MSYTPSHPNYAGIRTRSMSSRAALNTLDTSHHQQPKSGVTMKRPKSPLKQQQQQQERVPLQEALLNLDTDGSPRKPDYVGRAESSENRPPSAVAPTSFSPPGSPPKRTLVMSTTPPTSPGRVSLQESLLGLNKDGSPKSQRQAVTTASAVVSTTTPMRAPVQAALLSLVEPVQKAEDVRPESVEDPSNPFYVPIPPSGDIPSSPTKKRAADSIDSGLDDIWAASGVKRVRISQPELEAEPNPSLAQVLRKIDFLHAKRPRSPSPPLSLPPPQPEPRKPERSPQKRVRPSPLSPPRVPLPQVEPPSARRGVGEQGGIPHIDLLRVPGSASPVRQPGSPNKFDRVPRLEVVGGARPLLVWPGGMVTESEKGKEKAREREEEGVQDIAIDPSLLDGEPDPDTTLMHLSDLSILPPSHSHPLPASASSSGAQRPTSPSKVPTSRLPVRTTRLRAAPPPGAYRPPGGGITRSNSLALPPTTSMELSYPSERALAPPPSNKHAFGRTSLSSETQQTLHTLGEAMSKLSLPPPTTSRPPVRASTSAALPPKATHKRRSSVRVPLAVSTNAHQHAGDVSFGPLLGSAVGAGSGGGKAPLAGCVVFVDVRTKDGDDAGGVFVEMLRSLGARVLKTPTPSLTHLVLKSPHHNTLSRYHSLPFPKPEAVAVGWIVRCAEENRLVDAAEWRLDLDIGAGVSSLPGARRASGAGGGRSGAVGGGGALGRGGRRRSMEPRRVELIDEGSLSQIIPPMQEKIERLKRRSMMYQPKFSSPLRGSFVPSEGEEEKENMIVEGREA